MVDLSLMMLRAHIVMVVKSDCLFIFPRPLPPSLPPRPLPISVEFDLMLPFGSGSYNTLETISSNYGGAGVVFPYKVIFIDRSSLCLPPFLPSSLSPSIFLYSRIL